MTQYELIKKWREEAEKLREKSVIEYDKWDEDNNYEIDFYLDEALTLERCANELEALTY